MIQGIQKVIKVGSSGGVTIPAKELKRQNIAYGDEVEAIVRPLRSTNSEDQRCSMLLKRTAMLAGITLFEVNGLRFKAKTGEIEDFAVKIATDRMDVPKIAIWINGRI